VIIKVRRRRFRVHALTLLCGCTVRHRKINVREEVPTSTVSRLEQQGYSFMFPAHEITKLPPCAMIMIKHYVIRTVQYSDMSWYDSGTLLLIMNGLKFEVRAVILTISADFQTNL